MTTLLELKEKLVRFYGKYEVYITPIVKFIVAFAALMTIDRNIGYMELGQLHTGGADFRTALCHPACGRHDLYCGGRHTGGYVCIID